MIDPQGRDGHANHVDLQVQGKRKEDKQGRLGHEKCILKTINHCQLIVYKHTDTISQPPNSYKGCACMHEHSAVIAVSPLSPSRLATTRTFSFPSSVKVTKP